ncbi:MAG: hypothetical protein JW704_03090 [Anaerolineaceae bacterium]|nr:hypothetical protein [Anaerolineaceae bacterium]MBN2678432.1 hypothetical protein [Anaerolineaceae bacterium]
MTKTQDILKIAFTGELQASPRYLAFARKAEQDSCHQIAD